MPRKHTTFGKQLTNDASAPRSDRHSYGKFTLPDEAAREQQIGDIGASNQQEQQSGGHQEPESVARASYSSVP